MQLGAPGVAHAVDRPHPAVLLEVRACRADASPGCRRTVAPARRAASISALHASTTSRHRRPTASRQDRRSRSARRRRPVPSSGRSRGHHRPRYRLGRSAGRRSSRARQHHTIGAVRGVLSTDQYQLTMAQLYFRAGLHDRRGALRALLPLVPRLRRPSGGLLRRRRARPVRRVDRSAHGSPTTTSTRCAAIAAPPATRLFADDFLMWFAALGLRWSRHRRRARGQGGAPEHADDRRRGAPRGGAADRDPPAQPAQLRDPDRDQDVAHRRGQPRAARCSSSGCGVPPERVPTKRRERR